MASLGGQIWYEIVQKSLFKGVGERLGVYLRLEMFMHVYTNITEWPPGGSSFYFALLQLALLSVFLDFFSDILTCNKINDIKRTTFLEESLKNFRVIFNHYRVILHVMDGSRSTHPDSSNRLGT